MPSLSIPLALIVADPALQPRVDGLDPEHVRALEAVAEAWPPLKVVHRGGRYLLIDGFHRFAAAQNLGLTEIAVEILDVPQDGDLHALAFALNAAHGRPLTLTDRRAFAARLLCAHPELSDREIGRRAGLVQPTVAKIRQELESQAEIAPAETRLGRDGRSYPAKREPTASGTQARPESSPRISVIEVIERLVTPAERMAQRDLVHYFARVADLLEEQGDFTGFETIDAGAEACRVVLGDTKAKELAARLGWSARNIVAVAEELSDDKGEEPAP